MSAPSAAFRDASIRLKFSALASVLIVGMTLFIAIYIPSRLERQAMAAVTEKAESIARMMAYSLTAAVLFEDDAGIEDQFQEARLNPDLAFLVATDETDQVVEAFRLDVAHTASYKEGDGRVTLPNGREVYRTLTPMSLGARGVGSLYLGLSLDAVVATTESTRQGILFLSLVLLLAGIGAAAGLSHIVTRPLSLLTETADQVAQGDLSLRANTEAEAGDEVGTLARAFNQMVDRVQERTGALEREVVERTRAEAELTTRHEQMSVVAELGSKALVVSDTTALMQRAAERIAATLQLDGCEILEIDVDGNAVVRAGVGLPPGTVDGLPLSLGGPSDRAEVVIPPWPHSHSDLLQIAEDHPMSRYRDMGGRSCITVPVPGRQGAAGALTGFTREPRAFRPQDEGFIATVANLVGEALQRHRAEEALRRSEAQQGALLRALPDLILRVDSRGFIRDVRVSEAFTLDFDPQPGTALEEALPEPARELVGLVRDAAESDTVSDLEFRAHGTGGERDFEARVYPATDREVLILIRDVSERNENEAERMRLQEQLQHGEKLRSLGVLAGGIAHDFNNLLMGIEFNSGLLEEEIDVGSPLRARVEAISSTGQRLSELTNQMLAYSGKGRFVVESINLNETVRDLVHLVGASISKNVTVGTDLEDGIAAVQADSSQVHQVLMNLVINAAEAVGEGGGRVDVRTGSVSFENPPGWPGGHPTLKSGSYVKIVVEDDGTGMDTHTLSQIFEPFFTTKQHGRGLGLGAAQGIVRSHGGVIDVRSNVGEGTTFEVYLPADLTDTENAAEPVVIPGGPSAGIVTHVGGQWKPSGTALVVDDEDLVRDIAASALERLGFNVLLACDGQEGVQVFEENMDDIQIVLLDLTMPRKSGDEVYAEIQEMAPGTAVLFSSGFSESEAVKRLDNQVWVDFIQKPYRPKELRSKLENLLRNAPIQT